MLIILIVMVYELILITHDNARPPPPPPPGILQYLVLNLLAVLALLVISVALWTEA